jgi:hypothetical protein
MYGLSRELVELFEDRDVLVVVDDWRGGDPSAPRAPIFFAGRVFYRRDHDRLSDVFDVLKSAGADRWHASERQGSSLFNAGNYEDVVTALERCGRSMLFSFNRDLDAFKKPQLKAAWKAIRSTELGKAWTSDNEHAMALFAFLQRLAHKLGETMDRGLQLRVIVDHLDWHKGGLRRGGLSLLGMDDREDAWTIADKRDPTVASAMFLLGLVDSEAWAWGRMQTRALPAGDTVRARMLRWQDAGKPPGLLFTQEDVDQMLAGAAPNLRDYWGRMIRWMREGRSVELHEPE